MQFFPPILLCSGNARHGDGGGVAVNANSTLLAIVDQQRHCVYLRGVNGEGEHVADTGTVIIIGTPDEGGREDRPV